MRARAARFWRFPMSCRRKGAESRNRKKRVQNTIMMAKAGGEPMQSVFSYSRRMSHRGEFGISLKKAWWGCGAASALMLVVRGFSHDFSTGLDK